jgi:hypothetical protein
LISLLEREILARPGKLPGRKVAWTPEDISAAKSRWAKGGIRPEKFKDGYYWTRHAETVFVALRQNGRWYVPGVGKAVAFDTRQIICKVCAPDH